MDPRQDAAAAAGAWMSGILAAAWGHAAYSLGKAFISS